MIALKISKSRLKGVPKAVQQKALRAATTAGGYHFKSRHLMRRFTAAGARLLGYKPRRGARGSGRAFQGSYVQGKIKRRENGQGVKAIGENKPFVWSGESRNAVRTGAKVTATVNSATRSRFEIVAATPNFNRRGKNARIDLNEEFSRVADLEVQDTESVEAAAYEKYLQRYLSRG